MLSGDASEVSRRRSELLAGGPFEVCDVADDRGGALVRAVTTPALFSSTRVIAAENIERLSAEAATELAAAVSSARVVARAQRALPPSVKKALGKTAVFEKHDAATNASGRANQVKSLAREYGVQLRSDAASFVAQQYGDEVFRSRSVFVQLQAAGVQQAGIAELTPLVAGSPALAGWVVADDLAFGRVRDAVSLAGKVPAPVALASVVSLVVNATRLFEEEALTPASAATALGKPEWMVRSAVTLARRLDSGLVEQTWRQLVNAALASREPTPEGFVAAVASLGLLWYPPHNEG